MSMVPNSPLDTQPLPSKMEHFFRKPRLGSLLKQSNFFKATGFTCLEVFRFLFSLVFTHKNLYQTLQKTDSTHAPGKDTVYRFLNCPRYHWWRFLLLLSSRLIHSTLIPLTGTERENVLIFDDSLYSRARSRAVELLAKVYDHTTGKYVRGFRMLTLGWFDGNTFVPLCFSLLSSTKKNNRYVEKNEQIDPRSTGYRRRHESLQKASDTMIELLKQTERSA
jgi:hypothetical protein